jgi:ankyrin repeat protein
MTDLDRLIEAAQSGDLECVNSLLDKDRQLAGEKDESGATALHYAALNAHRSIVELLVERGANVNSRDGQFGATPAGWAIEYLRELGGYLSIELADLAFAIESGDVRWVKRFLTRFPALRRGFDPNGKAFQELARESGNPEIEKMFEEDAAS